MADNLARQVTETAEEMGLAESPVERLHLVEKVLDEKGAEGAQALTEQGEQQAEAVVLDLNAYRQRVLLNETLPASAQQQLEADFAQIPVETKAAAQTLSKEVEAAIKAKLAAELAEFQAKKEAANKPAPEVQPTEPAAAAETPTTAEFDQDTQAALEAFRAKQRARQAAKTPGVELASGIEPVAPAIETPKEKTEPVAPAVEETRPTEPEPTSEKQESAEDLMDKVRNFIQEARQTGADPNGRNALFRKIIFEIHPDRLASASPEVQNLARTLLAKINALRDEPDTAKFEVGLEEVAHMARATEYAEKKLPIETDWRSWEKDWRKEAEQSEDYLKSYAEQAATLRDIDREHEKYLKSYLKRAHLERLLASAEIEKAESLDALKQNNEELRKLDEQEAELEAEQEKMAEELKRAQEPLEELRGLVEKSNQGTTPLSGKETARLQELLSKEAALGAEEQRLTDRLQDLQGRRTAVASYLAELQSKTGGMETNVKAAEQKIAGLEPELEAARVEDLQARETYSARLASYNAGQAGRILEATALSASMMESSQERASEQKIETASSSKPEESEEKPDGSAGVLSSIGGTAASGVLLGAKAASTSLDVIDSGLTHLIEFIKHPGQHWNRITGEFRARMKGKGRFKGFFSGMKWLLTGGPEESKKDGEGKKPE